MVRVRLWFIPKVQGYVNEWAFEDSADHLSDPNQILLKYSFCPQEGQIYIWFVYFTLKHLYFNAYILTYYVTSGLK